MSGQRVLVGGRMFADALREDAASCRRWLRVQFSTFEGDAPGQALAETLLDRVAAGVEVQMILDGYSDVIADDVYPFAVRGRDALRTERRRTAELLARLEAAGVAIKRVAPPGRFARFILHRDHKKMVIVDDRVAYVGGINVSEHNFAWHDFMVRLEGPVLSDVVADFTSTWAGRTVALTRRREDRAFALNQCAGRPTVLEATIELVDGARRSIVLESPYLCGERIEGAILAAAERGVQVTLVTPWRPNHLHNRLWVRKLRRRLHHGNIRLLGYPGVDGMTHAKLLIVDDAVATFGSLNFQEIEALTQKELNVFTREPGLVAELGALAAADAEASRPVPRPRSAFGWWTYRLLHSVVRRWTGRLLRRPAWRASYC